MSFSGDTRAGRRERRKFLAFAVKTYVAEKTDREISHIVRKYCGVVEWRTIQRIRQRLGIKRPKPLKRPIDMSEKALLSRAKRAFKEDRMPEPEEQAAWMRSQGYVV